MSYICLQCGKANAIVNHCGCDKQNAPTIPHRVGETYRHKQLQFTIEIVGLHGGQIQTVIRTPKMKNRKHTYTPAQFHQTLATGHYEEETS